MKKILLFAIVLISVATFSSCSKNTLTTTNPVYSLTNSKVSNGYLETELEIKGEVSGEVSGKFKFIGKGISGRNKKYIDDNNTNFFGRSNIDSAKAYALYETAKKAGCDIILAPIYEIEIHEAFLAKDRFTVKVSGIGANIKSVKQKSIRPNVVD